MLEELHIAGHAKRTLPDLLKKRPGELDAIIITNKKSDFPDWVKDKVNSYLHLAFDDATWALGDIILPSKEHIQEALDWIKGKKKVVVACHAGKSRSSATAYLIACQEWNYKNAIEILSPNKHWPNTLVVKLGSEVLNNPEIWNNFVKWHNQYSSQDEEISWDDLSDNPPEIENIEL